MILLFLEMTKMEIPIRFMCPRDILRRYSHRLSLEIFYGKLENIRYKSNRSFPLQNGCSLFLHFSYRRNRSIYSHRHFLRFFGGTCRNVFNSNHFHC